MGGVWLSSSSELCLRAVNGSDCAKSDGVWVIGFVSGFVGTRTKFQVVGQKRVGARERHRRVLAEWGVSLAQLEAMANSSNRSSREEEEKW